MATSSHLPPSACGGEIAAEISRNALTLPTAGVFLAAAVYFGFAWAADRRDKGSLALATLSLGALAQVASSPAWASSSDSPAHSISSALATGVAAGVSSLSVVAYAAWHHRRPQVRAWVTSAALCCGAILLSLRTSERRPMIMLAVCALIGIGAIGHRTFAAGEPGWRARIFGASLIVVAAVAVLDHDTSGAASLLTLAALACILFADQVLTMRRNERELNIRRIREADLELALRRRSMAPHFLLNTLNGMAELVETDPPRAVAMIEILGHTFRTLAKAADRPLIDLSDEIRLCRAHVDLMSFRSDIHLTFDVIGRPDGLATPPGALLTLVENAFAHGRY